MVWKGNFIKHKISNSKTSDKAKILCSTLFQGIEEALTHHFILKTRWQGGSQINLIRTRFWSYVSIYDDICFSHVHCWCQGWTWEASIEFSFDKFIASLCASIFMKNCLVYKIIFYILTRLDSLLYCNQIILCYKLSLTNVWKFNDANIVVF